MCAHPLLVTVLLPFLLTKLWWCLRYFEDEDEQQQPQLEYIPAPDSPSNKKSDCDSDSSEDPLDAFMEGLEKEVCYGFFLQLSI